MTCPPRWCQTEPAGCSQAPLGAPRVRGGKTKKEVALRFYVEYTVTVPGIFKYYPNGFVQVYKYLNQAFS